ncbi:MAG: diguanylate cyclase [Solirubrobacterales bacterium]
MTDLGLHRGPRQTFRPIQRPLEPNIVLTDERLRVHRNVFWFGAATMYSVAGGLILFSALLNELLPDLNLPPDMTSPLTLSVAAFSIGLSGFWLLLASRDTPAYPWMNFIVGAGTVMIAIISIGAEDYGPDLLSYFLVPALAAAFFMPFKQAIWHLLAIAAVELYVAFNSSNVPDGKVISLNILFFTMMSAGMLMVARKRIQDGILHNVALAGRDPLTGVANLRKFNERLQTEADRADRSGEPLTLLMIDLDDFKLVNDRYSYTLGDAVLVASARAMSRVVRAAELLARRGGDEFAVIAVGADVEAADALARRIKHAVRRERLKLCPDVTPEASIGVAEWRPGETGEELVRRADSALHVSKIIAHSDEPFAET